MRSSFAWIVLMCVSGCGLSDYQARLDAHRARLQDFDEANRMLDDPIDLPRIAFEKPGEQPTEMLAWPDICLRLPKGSPTIARDKAPYLYPFPFYRYGGGNDGATNIFIVAAAINTDPKAKDEWGKYSRGLFRDLIRRALEDYYQKTNKVPLTFPDKVEPRLREVKVVTAYPNPAAPKISYSTYAYSDEQNKAMNPGSHSVFEVYIREEAGKQVGIVVQRPLRPTNPDTRNKSIEACLGSLDIADANARRLQYKRPKGT